VVLQVSTIHSCLHVLYLRGPGRPAEQVPEKGKQIVFPFA